MTEPKSEFPREALITLLEQLPELATVAGRDTLLASFGIDPSLVPTDDIPVRSGPGLLGLAAPTVEGEPTTRIVQARIDIVVGANERDKLIALLQRFQPQRGRGIELGVATGMSPRQFAEQLTDYLIKADRIAVAVSLARRVQRDPSSSLGQVATDLANELKRLTRAESTTGWLGIHHVHKYTLTDRFYGRTDYLEDLDRWVTDGNPVRVLYALGGVGKSALAAHWLKDRATSLQAQGIRGAMWCSFYAKDFDFAAFLEDAIGFLGQIEKQAIPNGRGKRESMLLELLERERFVVVLDGIERLMHGYAPVYHRVVEDDRTRESVRDRELSDPQDSDFIRGLARSMRSRILIVTRLVPSELEEMPGTARPFVELNELVGFSPEEGTTLCKSIMSGHEVPPDLLRVLEVCGWHPLVINIVTRAVVASDGDWDAWCRRPEHDPQALLANQTDANRAYLVKACLQDLGDDERSILAHLATSGKPLNETDLERALVGSSPDRIFLAADGLQASIASLERLGLIGIEPTTPRIFDVHPIVRGAIWGIITDPKRQRLVRSAVSEFLETPDRGLASLTTLDDLGQAINIYKALVDRGSTDHAWDMFVRRLWAPLLGQNEENVALRLLSRLLPDGNDQRLVALSSREQQAAATGLIGDMLVSIGQSYAGVRHLLWSGAISLQLGDIEAFLDRWQSRAWLSLYAGELFETEVALRRMRVQAARHGLTTMLPVLDSWLALVLSLRGSEDEAKQAFARAEACEFGRWWAQAVAEGMLYLGKPDVALTWIEKAKKDVRRPNIDPRSLAWEHITSGMALLELGDIDQARGALSAALTIANQSEYEIVRGFALVHLAQLSLNRGQLAQAERELDRYFEERRFEYALVACDAWQVRALCHKLRGNDVLAREAACKAYNLATCDGPPFIYSRGMLRARLTLEVCGAQLPIGRSRLPGDWREQLTATTTEFDSVALRSKQDSPSAYDVIRMEARKREVSPEDASWLGSVSGGDESPLYEALLEELHARRLTVADLRAAYSANGQQSLELTFLDLEARTLITTTPCLVDRANPGAAEQWLAGDHVPIVMTFLETPIAKLVRRAFEFHELDQVGIEAFLADNARRLKIEEDPLANRWWDRLVEQAAPMDLLILTECIRARDATLPDILKVLPTNCDRAIEAALALVERKRAVVRFLYPKEPSRSEGWSEVMVMLRTEDLKHRLGWEQIRDTERAFWRLEERETRREALRLLEEVAIRKMTLRDLEHARDTLATTHVGATLLHLDYQRARHAKWTPPASWNSGAGASSADTNARLAAARRELKLAEASFEATAWWSELEVRCGNATTAIRLLNELWARHQTIASAFELARACTTENPEALLAYLDCMALRPRKPDFNDEGNWHFNRGDYAAAISAYEKSIAEAVDPIVFSNLAGAWERATHVSKAEALGRVVESRQAAVSIKKGDVTAERAALRYAELRKRIGDTKGYQLLEQLPVVTPIAFEVSRNLIPFFASDGTSLDAAFERHLAGIRQHFAENYGVTLPGVRVRGDETELRDGSYSILFDEIAVGAGNVSTSRRFCTNPYEIARAAKVTEAFGIKGVWLASDLDHLHSPAGTWDLVEYPLRHLDQLIRRNLASFCGHQDVANWLERDAIAPEIASSGERLSELVEVCRTLLEELVPIRHLGEIASQCLAMHGGDFEELVRSLRLLPSLRLHLPGNASTDQLYTLGDSEQAIATAAISQRGTRTLALTPTVTQKFLSELRKKLPSSPRGAVIVESAELRPYIRSVIRLEFPDLFAIARAELQPDYETRLAKEPQ